MKIDFISIALSFVISLASVAIIFGGNLGDLFDPLVLIFVIIPWIGTFSFYALKSSISLGLKKIFPNNGAPIVFSFFNKNTIKFENRAVHLFNLLINLLLLPASFLTMRFFADSIHDSFLIEPLWWIAFSFWWHAQFAVWLNMLPIFGSDSYMFLRTILSKEQLKGVSLASSGIFGIMAAILAYSFISVDRNLGGIEISFIPIITTFAMSAVHSFMKNLAVEVNPSV